MAKAMGANAKLAANVVLTTTLGSVVTLSTAIYIVRLLGIV
jgi:predicted permease